MHHKKSLEQEKKISRKNKVLFIKWLRRTLVNLKLLVFDNFYLVNYFLFFIFLKIKNKKQCYGIVKLFFSLNNNKYLVVLKRLTLIKKKFFFFNGLYLYLLFKVTSQWNLFLLKNFSKKFFKKLQFKLGFSRLLFLAYLKKILNFFFNDKAVFLLSFLSSNLTALMNKVGKNFYAKKSFYARPSFFFSQDFYWRFSNKNRYFFSSMLLWIYFIFDKITFVYWLAFFFFWLRNFIFLLFGLNWLWITSKDDIFKAFEYSRNIHISFHNNLFVKDFNSLDYATVFFNIFNKVKTISCNFNFVYYQKNFFEDWDVYSSFYFFQDKGLNFFLKMQQDTLAFNVFLDRFFKKSEQVSLGESSGFFSYFLDFQLVKPNMKNYWFLDRLQDQRNFLFFFKKLVTQFFPLKNQKNFFVPGFFFSSNFLELPVFPIFEEPLKSPLSSKIFFYLKRFFFERFFLFFLDKFIFFSYFFFQHFFIYNFFFKFVKIITLCFFNFFNTFFFKMHAAKHRFIYFYFCLFLKIFFRQERFSTLGYGFFFDLLHIDSWQISLPANPPVRAKSNFFLQSLLKSFSFFQGSNTPVFFFKSAHLIRKISKKFLFWEIFFKRLLYLYWKKKAKLLQLKNFPFLTFFSSFRLKRLRAFSFFFIALQEALVFRRKASKTLADFSMEDFLAFDLFSLSSFFFKPLSSFAQLSLPLVFWNHFKLKFFSFFQAKSFFYLQKLCLKALKTFMHFFFFLQKQFLGKYLEFFKKASQNFLKAVFLLKKIKVSFFFNQKFSNVFVPSFSFFHTRFFSSIAQPRRKEFFSFLLNSLKFPSFFFNNLFKEGKNLVMRDSLAHSFPFFNAPNFFINDFQVQTFFTKKFFLKKISFTKFLKKAHSFTSNFLFNKLFSVKKSSVFFSFSRFFFAKLLAKSFAPQKLNFFKHLSLSKIFNENKNFYFFSGFRSLPHSKLFPVLRFYRSWKSKKLILAQYLFRQKKFYKKNVLVSFNTKLNIFSKGVLLPNPSKFFYGSKNSFNYKSYSFLFNSFFLQALQKKITKFFFSLENFFCKKKFLKALLSSNFFFDYDFTFFKKFFSNRALNTNFSLFSPFVAKSSRTVPFLNFFFKSFLKKIFLLQGSFKFSAMPFLSFFFSSFSLFKGSRKFFVLYFFSLLKTFFFGDVFFFNRSLFYFDFFSTPWFSRDLFFFKFFSVNFSFLASFPKKNAPGKDCPRKRKNLWTFPFSNYNCFIYKSKGFIFFLRKFEVLLFLDDIYIWYFCFRDRIIKKRLVFGSSRVFFFKPFFFDKALFKSFSFLQLLKSLPQWSFLAKSFNYLYNKRLIKQKSIFLSFYFFNNKLLLHLDNFFWSLVSFKQLGFFFKTHLKTNPFQFFLLKQNCFFVPFFFKERNLHFFLAMPAFMQKVSLSISLNFLQPQQGSFLALNKFFFPTYSKPIFCQKRLTSKFSLRWFNKRIIFLKNLLNPFLSKSFIFLKWLRFYRRLKFSDLSPFKWRHFHIFQSLKKQMHTSWGAKFFVPSKNRTLLVLEPKAFAKTQGFNSFRLSPYTFFLHYFYHYKVHLQENTLVFFRYFNNLLQKFDFQVQRDFFFSFLRFFWKFGRKYWYIKIANDFYVWDFGKKTWFLYKKPSLLNFFFPPKVLVMPHSIFVSRIHFKIFNSSVFNQFFSFSFIKRWTSWKFFYRMHDFMAQLSIQRTFIRRGLSLNYRGITLANSFFGTYFPLNNYSFYSFNNLLLKSLLYNVKSVFFFNIHNIFSRESLIKLFTQKTFFSLYSFFPLFSKSIFNIFTHFKRFTQSLFFFSSFSFFVRSSVHGFFWNYLSFINPFIRMKKYSLTFKAKFFDSHFCNFLFLDFKDRFFYSKFYGAHLNALWRKALK